jgi:iron(III) transport system permease protein
MTHQYIKLNSFQGKVAVLFCLIPFLFGFFIPAGRLLLWSISASPDFFDLALIKIIMNSVILATLSSPMIVFLSVFLIFSTKYFKSHILKIFNKFAILGYSMPGAVIAVGVLLSFSKLNEITDMFITGTILSLLFAYIVRFLAVSWQPIDSSLERKCSNLNEAARDLGKSPLFTFLKINLPLIQKSILGALILVFIDIFKELPLTLILRPFNFETLATLTFDLNKQAQIYEAAIPALIIILVSSLPIILLNKYLDSKI